MQTQTAVAQAATAAVSAPAAPAAVPASAAAPRALRRLDYAAPAWTTASVSMTLRIARGATRVEASSRLKRVGAAAAAAAAPLVLDVGTPGVVRLESLAVNGVALLEGVGYTLVGDVLTVAPPAGAEEFELTVVTVVNPEANTELNGLYYSNGIFVTQCEATGFRNITFAQVRARRAGEEMGRARARACAHGMCVCTPMPPRGRARA
jgi:aminopeptidase N